LCEILKCTLSSIFGNLRILSILILCFLGTTQQHLGYYECLITININFWNSSSLTRSFPWQLFTECICDWKDPQMQCLPFSAISCNANFISSHTKVQMFYIYTLFILLRLFSFVQSISNLQNWQTAVTIIRPFILKFHLQYFRLSSVKIY